MKGVYYSAIVAGSIIFYAIIYVSVYIKNSFICQERIELEQWTQDYISAAMGAFGFICVIQTKRLLSHRRDEFFEIEMSTLVINILGGLTLGLEMMVPNSCVDNFGSVTYASNWCSWLITVPLLTYTCITSDFGTFPGHLDSIAIASNFVCILFGLLMQIHNLPIYLTGLFLMFSWIFLVIGIYHMILSNLAERYGRPHTDYKKMSSSISETVSTPKVELKQQLSLFLGCILPMFGVVATLAMIGAISKESSYLCTTFLNLVSKGVIAFTAMDTHSITLHSIRAQLTSEIAFNQRRREFVRYMFHETRIPLNSFTMGLDSLNTESMDQLDREVVQTMKVSSEYLERSLDSYLVMLDMEEGTFELSPTLFRSALIWEELGNFLNSKYSDKGLSVDIDFSKSKHMPYYLVGDVPCLLFAFRNLLGFALTRCSSPAVIHVEVECRSVHGDEDGDHLITVRFEDTGGPVEEKKLSLMLKPYGMLFAGDMLNDEGAGLSLAIASSIIRMHQGRVSIHRTEVGLSYGIGVQLPVTIRKESSGVRMQSSAFDLIRKNPTRIHPTGDKDFISSSNNKFLMKGKFFGGDVFDPGSLEDQIRIQEDNELLEKITGTAFRGALLRGMKETDKDGRLVQLTASDIAVSGDVVLDKQDALKRDSHAVLHRSDTNADDWDKSSAEEEAGGGATGLRKEATDVISGGKDAPPAAGNFELIKREPNLKCLVVDDTNSNRKLLQYLLKKEGVKTDSAENGAEAVNAFAMSTEPYDVIFMDYTMPIMNGVEATKIIREMHFEGCIVAVTGNAMDDDVCEFFRAGADAVVTKPMTLSKLKVILSCFDDIEDGMVPRERMMEFGVPKYE